MILKNREKGERFQKLGGRSFRHSKWGISSGNRESWHVCKRFDFIVINEPNFDLDASRCFDALQYKNSELVTMHQNI